MSKGELDLHCVDCGCNRGGVIDLAEKPTVLRCFECAKRKEVNKDDRAKDRVGQRQSK